jgi:dimethylsulfoniopropionate demethylase
VGLSLIDRGFWDIGQPVRVHTSDGVEREGEIVPLPMI